MYFIALALGRGLRETRLVFAGSCCNKQTGGIILKGYTEETNYNRCQTRDKGLETWVRVPEIVLILRYIESTTH